MKKILLFLLLLVNLQLTTDSGSLGIGLGEVAAQNMNNELSEIVVTGSADVYCNQCWSRINRNDINYHKQYTCTKRIVKCSYCPQKFEAWQEAEHICRYHSSTSTSTSGSRCAKCGKPDSQCTCPSHCPLCNRPIGYCWCNITVTGKGGNIGYSVTGGSGVSGGSSGTNNTPQNSSTPIGDPSGTPHKKITTKDLEKIQGITLLPNLPEKLHPQTRKKECVARAIAQMVQYRLNLNNAQYNEILYKLESIAEFYGSTTYDLDFYGIPADAIQGLFNDYLKKNWGCVIKRYGDNRNKNTNDIDISNIIANYINNRIPVAACSKEHPPHMVTIVGYTSDHYYQAGGDREGKASECNKFELEPTIGPNQGIFVIEFIENK